MELRPRDDRDRAWIAEFMSQEWGLPVVSISGPHDPSELPGFVAVQDDQRIGIITYRTGEQDCEVVTLNSLRRNRGVGTGLLRAVKLMADQRGLRLWLITTDGNSEAIRFYENRGMTRRALYRDFIETVRTYKPDAPRAGHAYRDAIEFSY